jgi:hypothetical protein
MIIGKQKSDRIAFGTIIRNVYAGNSAKDARGKL